MKTVTRKKKDIKRTFYGLGAFMAVFLSVALVLTSFDFTVLIVQAEESADSGDETGDEPRYVTNDAGAIIINGFQSLGSIEQIELDQKGTLEEVTARMPSQIWVSVTKEEPEQPPESSSEESSESQPDNSEPTSDSSSEEGGESQPDNGEQPSESSSEEGSESQPESSEQPSEGSSEEGGASQPESSEQPSEGSSEEGGASQPDSSGQPSESSSGENGGTQTEDDSQEGNGSGDEESGTGDASSEEPQQAPEKDRRDRQWTTAWRQDAGIRVNIELLSEGGIILPDSSEEPFSEPAGENSSELTEENLSEPTEENSSESTEENPLESTEGNSSESTEGNPSKPTEGNSSESTEENPSKPTEGNPSESTEENPSESTEENPSESTEENPSESTEENPSESTEENPSESLEENPSESTEENPSTLRYKKVQEIILIDVTWECTEDYVNTELESYTFRPVWNTADYVYEGDPSNIPVITVTISPKVNGIKVHNQEELQTALDNKAERIVMTGNISLTSSLLVPAFADIVLDGGGYSLLRGDIDSGKFTGAMLFVKGADEGEEYGEETLTLTNIHVNGRTDESNDQNRAEAPAIIVCGNLILDDGAYVEGNRNYGTSDGQGSYTVRPIGGGLLVYGRLRIREGAVVENNYAAGAGGGVYLEKVSELDPGLYLHADVIWNNYAGGDGKDLYASAGCFVSYAPSINLKDKTGKGSYYIDQDAKVYELGPDKPPVVDPPEIVEGNVEVFLSIHRDSGYSDEEIARLTSALKEKGITVITPGRTDIDTTDLRNWYVYDHYEPLQWGGQNVANVIPQAWQDVYGGNPKRSYYAYIPQQYYHLDNPTNGNPVNTIEEWLGRQEDYTPDAMGLRLAQFKEHIYSGRQMGLPQMTFAGYGEPAYVDFLYYDPESNGEKVVNFDVDSSKVLTHTLQGTGFLVNAGVENGIMHGYLVYYTYYNTSANCIYLCDLNGISAEELHHRDSYTEIVLTDYSCMVEDSNGIEVSNIQITEWQNEMSIQIVATPDSIVVRQQPKNAEGSIDKVDPILTYRIPEDKRDNTYSGFGPLVAYTNYNHSCNRASAFTYSNLRMYFTNPVLERGDMLTPLQEADYTQAGDQRYFLNIFGDSQLEYNDTADFGQYQELLYIMQSEGVALITDRDSPFESYLGEAPEGNLCEVKPGSGSRLSIDELVNQVVTYVANKESTKLNVEEDRLTQAAPKQSVGNISLWSMNGSQIRSLKVPAEGYAIQINDMSYRLDEAEPSYSILKPGAPGYAALDINPFIVTNDEKEWPAGEYTIRQRYPASSIYGYSYFTLVKDPPASQPTVTPEKPVFQRPSVSYEGEASEEFVQMEAPGNQAVPGGPAEPKTGDRRLPPMPVAMGACTMFMLKLLLWMYEMEMGITDQVKDEMLQTLIDWAKGTTKPRIYLALMAISVVLVIYHMFKEMNAKRKRMAVKRREK